MKEFILIALGIGIGYMAKAKIEETKRLKEENAILKSRNSDSSKEN